ncbi:MAG: amidohydrolase family protein [Rhodospirillales bacterium]|nr:amidohydrolase family protein [Rhodospirillales bacterium]MCY4003623.1 amidohydrolase family protein [Rhodospirillales bacterium]
MYRKTLHAALLAASLTGLAGCAALPPVLGESQPAAATLTLDAFQGEGAACYDRASQPYTAVVDSHLHFRPFGGPALPFDEVVQYLENTGVRFANVYGIGQMLPVNSDCTYYLDCVGTLVSPTMKNDFVNAMNFLASGSDEVHLTMSMTFPDLEEPDSVLVGMRLLDDEFPGVFGWMGEVNLVKQALFGNFHAVVPLATIPRWAPFMAVLRFRGTPLAIHSDLGNDADPTQYLPWIEEVLRLYPHNKIVWMHLGLSRELVAIDPDTHIGILESLLDRYPNLMVDISWRVIDDNVFSDPELRDRYIPFLNAYSDRVLPGTDFVASANKNFDIYQAELDVTSRILAHLDDAAFRNIALGENYFRIMGLDYVAPEICASSP